MKRLFQSAVMCSVALALAFGGAVRAQDEAAADGDAIVLAELPVYWIGVHAKPIDEALKSHLGLEDRLMIAHVVPDSPAERAGLRQHDILLNYGGARITSLQELMAAVEAGKATETSVTFLRGGKETKRTITAQERPDHIIDLPFPERAIESVEDLFRKTDKPWRARFLGPGFLLNRQVEALPNGVSIEIKKENDEPAKITVKRGQDSWEVTEDSLDLLPEDLREPVKRHLTAQADHDRAVRGGEIFQIDPNGAIRVDPRRFVPDAVQPRVEEALRRAEQLMRRFEKDDKALQDQLDTRDKMFKAMQEQIEALGREVEKLRNDKAKAKGKDEAKPDNAPEA